MTRCALCRGVGRYAVSAGLGRVRIIRCPMCAGMNKDKHGCTQALGSVREDEGESK